jgi:hypothetical protein
MTKETFRGLFQAALEAAASNADEQLGRRVSRNFRIRFGEPKARPWIDPDTALDRLYLGANRFYLIIDVAVVEAAGDWTAVYVRPSGHRPGSFEQTWNDPPGSGPFKQLVTGTIKTHGELTVR